MISLKCLFGVGIHSATFRSGGGFQTHQAVHRHACRVFGSQLSTAARKGGKFFDRVTFEVEGGKGGDGCISHDHLGFRQMRPDGGHGGRGGSVIIHATSNCRHLALRGRQKAQSGKNGSSAGKFGRNGKDLKLKVPLGTVVYEVIRHPIHNNDTESHSDEYIPVAYEEEEVLLADMDIEGAKLLVADGGLSGKGNMTQVFMSNKFYGRMTADDAKGTKGTLKRIRLELKTIADVGLVGYPNAGKSTLLRTISRAKPKVASYPFTTLHPNVGTVEYSDYGRITVADIPGLVDGAHENRGLGHSFLRHIERTKVLVYVIDVMAGITEKRGYSPAKELESLVEELELYMPGLSNRPSLVIANKMDLLRDPERKTLIDELGFVMPHSSVGVFHASAKAGGGVREIVRELRSLVESVKEKEEEEKNRNQPRKSKRTTTNESVYDPEEDESYHQL